MKSEQEYKELIDQHPEIGFFGTEIYPFIIKGTPEWNSQRAKLYKLYPKYVKCVEWLKTNPEILKPGYEGQPAQWDSLMDEWDIFIPQGILLLARL